MTVDYHVHRIAIFTGVVVFTVIGLFGNISLIALHIRRPTLRTKYGLLISLLSFCQSICLIFEWVGGIYVLSTPTTGLLATIATDLLISIALPLLHRVSPHGTYVLIISLPSVLYGLLSVAFGFIFTDNGPINMCNPPSSLSDKVKDVWYAVALAAGAVTVFSYVLAYLILVYNSKRHANQPQELARRSMRTLSIILLIFLFTRYMATIGANVLNMANVNPDAVALYQNYCVSYCKTKFYSINQKSDYSSGEP
ncbi:hypothetical protein NECAME_05554 [Necator americanus]|uniref:G-protein coupled receptors family 1 profile domain-containing protein n=1 Tax=Necator americanus TaxID=51031 RepID=W2SG61_NECAM|nr:hypothetical protein NECAME_05554 [Necator americanus]ETN68590.1 hypothetical protein NECAME_05554 [Necator americanus]